MLVLGSATGWGTAGAAPSSIERDPGVAARYADGLRIESRTTYAFDPAALVVHVRFDATLKNTQPDVVSGGFIRQRYYSSFGVPTVAEAVNVTATKAGGSPLSVAVEPTSTPLFSLAVADLAPDLFYPSSVQISITYDIPALAPRSDGLTRINKAFATFPTFAVGDPGLASVEVLMPDGWDVEVIGSEMTKTERDDGLVSYTAEAIGDPDTWQAELVARQDDELVLRTVDLGEHDLIVQGWPDDPEWADFVATQVGDGVPVLEELIGRDWPAEADVDLVETVAPYLYGYGGWYQPSYSLIEVGDELDQKIILHELSHVWFNDDLFAGRWISEGLAEDFCTRTMAELDAEVPAPAEVRVDDPGVLRLNTWGDPDLQDGQSEAQEVYGYNTSWSVVDRIVDEIGAEQMTAVLQRAFAHELPYGAETVPGILSRQADWRTFLDLLEEVGGSTTATQVFRDLVIAPEDARMLDERAEARTAYAELVEAADGWAGPRVIRANLSNWKFDDAVEDIEPAIEVLAVRDDLQDELGPLDVELPAAYQEAYEGAQDVEELADYADDALAAGQALRAAQEAKDEGAGPFGVVGLVGSSVDDDLAATHRAFRAGDYDETLEQAAAVREEMDSAATAGIIRLVAALVALVLLVLVIRALRKRRGRRSAARAEAPVGSEDLVSVRTAPPVLAPTFLEGDGGPGPQPASSEDEPPH